MLLNFLKFIQRNSNQQEIELVKNFYNITHEKLLKVVCESSITFHTYLLVLRKIKN